MNKITALFINILLACTLHAQVTAKDIFKAEVIVWYGLDFSHAKLIGVGNNAEKAKEKYVTECNNTSYYDREIFPMEGCFGKFKVPVDNKVVTERNNAVSFEQLTSKTPSDLSDATINKIISEYNSSRKEGIGAVFIVDYLDKAKNEAAAYVTFFDIATKKVLLTKGVISKLKVRVAAAAGRNSVTIGRTTNPNSTLHWAITFGNICEEMSVKYLSEWKEEVGAE